MERRALLMNEKDNVAVVLDNIEIGDIIKISHNGSIYYEVEALDNIETFHKVAVKDIKLGEEVLKYGEVIGKAIKDIRLGEHSHINNIGSVMVL